MDSAVLMYSPMIACLIRSDGIMTLAADVPGRQSPLRPNPFSAGVGPLITRHSPRCAPAQPPRHLRLERALCTKVAGSVFRVSHRRSTIGRNWPAGGKRLRRRPGAIAACPLPVPVTRRSGAAYSGASGSRRSKRRAVSEPIKRPKARCGCSWELLAERHIREF